MDLSLRSNLEDKPFYVYNELLAEPRPPAISCFGLLSNGKAAIRRGRCATLLSSGAEREYSGTAYERDGRNPTTP